ncbi:esterase/lipase family protein [Kerstersia sp.]|uniref:esterase/lipase family protein n=1 Tax=Kerstersia sp. TaxID=1930783 RepID=UPI003F912B59
MMYGKAWAAARRVRWARWAGVAVAVTVLQGCSLLREFQPSVVVKPMTANEYITLQRGDILTTGKLSEKTAQTIRVTGLDQGDCAVTASLVCIEALGKVQGILDEQRMSALSELWLQWAMKEIPNTHPEDPGGLAPWMEAARHAYAYLFFTPRSPGERAFEDRQTQVRDWYNYAVQEAVARLFAVRRNQPAASDSTQTRFRLGDWLLDVDLALRLPEGVDMVKELVPASSLAFQGLRSTYRRDGFGAELVAVMDEPALNVLAADAVPPDPKLEDSAQATREMAERGSARPAKLAGDEMERARHGGPEDERARRWAQWRAASWSEMPSPNITVVFRYAGQTLEEVLASREVNISVHDPLVERDLTIDGEAVPLAGNFTAGYGLWLARSGFNRQSLSNLFGRDDGMERPHLYMMQPYDPNRRIILMLHGLASSPEAWVNVANEIMGDEALRAEFQVWQVYYPTNLPLVFNHVAIRRLLERTLHHFDPDGSAAASQGLVLVGHSMGGMISRMMISSADEQLWDWALKEHPMEPERLERLRSKADPMLRFQPFPGVERAVFIAAPHRGTPVAGHTLVRWIASFIRLPLTILENFDDALQARPPGSGSGELTSVPTSIDNLNEHDSFVKTAADLPISDAVRYHSIIARQQPKGPLLESDDGVVPYRSAHLPKAVSEKIIVAGHSVQETAAAILELRRILHEDIAEQRRRSGKPAPALQPLQTPLAAPELAAPETAPVPETDEAGRSRPARAADEPGVQRIRLGPLAPIE